jgi:hypothetical protein
MRERRSLTLLSFLFCETAMVRHHQIASYDLAFDIFSIVTAITVDETWRVLRDEFELDDCLVPHVSVEMSLV